MGKASLDCEAIHRNCVSSLGVDEWQQAGGPSQVECVLLQKYFSNVDVSDMFLLVFFLLFILCLTN